MEAQEALKELWLSTKRARSEDDLPALLEKDNMAARHVSNNTSSHQDV